LKLGLWLVNVGPWAIPGETPISEPLAHIAWLAGQTTRIRLSDAGEFDRYAEWA
jgi:alkanesulfonate monooxygenase SsuD/methylene tetrahydromethanopterin reductase-like flavin-dependent oxidoreductase (luciferase family)